MKSFVVQFLRIDNRFEDKLRKITKRRQMIENKGKESFSTLIYDI